MPFIIGQIENSNGPQKFNILDVSKSGAKLRTEHDLTNSMLTLIFPSIGKLHATLEWQEGGTAGVTFIEPHNEVIVLMGKVMPLLEPMLRAA